MEITNFRLIKFLLYLNCIYFVMSSSIHLNSELFNEEGSGVDINLIPIDENHISKYELNVAIMEEKINALSDTFNQLEQKMKSFINDNMDALENNIRKIMDQTVEEKLKDIDEIMKEKLDLISKSKISYNVHELKCPNNLLPKSCYDLSTCNSNIYSMMIPDVSPTPFPAVCDLKTLNGGWTIIQRRQDGSENFYRNWTDYVEGFGSLNGEFFIGLEKLYVLTSLGEPQELYIILEDFEGEKRYARYGEFKVDSKSTEYKLKVGQYSGDASDCLSQHSGQKFSTNDRDNDISPKNCAAIWKGGWWYRNCLHSNLNGMYLAGKINKLDAGVKWCGFRNYEYSLKFVQMMIRPKKD